MVGQIHERQSVIAAAVEEQMSTTTHISRALSSAAAETNSIERPSRRWRAARATD